MSWPLFFYVWLLWSPCSRALLACMYAWNSGTKARARDSKSSSGSLIWPISEGLWRLPANTFLVKFCQHTLTKLPNNALPAQNITLFRLALPFKFFENIYSNLLLAVASATAFRKLTAPEWRCWEGRGQPARARTRRISSRVTRRWTISPVDIFMTLYLRL